MADFCIGDIVWAKIGKLPFWPSIVCADPKLHKHVREDKNKIALHVRFFNDKGRRCWVNNFKMYHGEKDNLVPLNPYILQPKKKILKIQRTWENAVKEAYRFQQLNRAVRISIFSQKYDIPLEKLLMKNAEVCLDEHLNFKKCHVVLNKKEVEEQLKNNNIFLPEQLDYQNWKPKTKKKLSIKENIPKIYYNFEKGFNHVV